MNLFHVPHPCSIACPTTRRMGTKIDLVPFTLASRTALVTGAGRGIGRAIAEKLAEYGASVMINDLDPAPASETEAAIHQAGGQAASLCGDVTDPAFPDRLVPATLERFG